MTNDELQLQYSQLFNSLNKFNLELKVLENFKGTRVNAALNEFLVRAKVFIERNMSYIEQATLVHSAKFTSDWDEFYKITKKHLNEFQKLYQLILEFSKIATNETAGNEKVGNAIDKIKLFANDALYIDEANLNFHKNLLTENEIKYLSSKLMDMEEKVNFRDFDKKAEEKIRLLEEKTQKYESDLDELRKLLESQRDEVSSQTADENVRTFKHLESSHKNHQSFWAFCLFVSTIVSILIIYHLYTTEVAEAITMESILVFLRKFLLLSIPILLFRISLTKYNAERGLVIAYRTRITALSQFKDFEALLKNDFDGKNLLRAEIARYLFNDPHSSYYADNSSDINISPIIGTAERFANTASKMAK